MPNHRHHQLAIPADDTESFRSLSPDPSQSHTHVQQVARREPVDGRGGR